MEDPENLEDKDLRNVGVEAFGEDVFEEEDEEEEKTERTLSMAFERDDADARSEELVLRRMFCVGEARGGDGKEVRSFAAAVLSGSVEVDTMGGKGGKMEVIAACGDGGDRDIVNIGAAGAGAGGGIALDNDGADEGGVIPASIFGAGAATGLMDAPGGMARIGAATGSCGGSDDSDSAGEEAVVGERSIASASSLKVSDGNKRAALSISYKFSRC
jgi:hypothetical protein